MGRYASQKKEEKPINVGATFAAALFVVPTVVSYFFEPSVQESLTPIADAITIGIETGIGGGVIGTACYGIARGLDSVFGSRYNKHKHKDAMKALIIGGTIAGCCAYQISTEITAFKNDKLEKEANEKTILVSENNTFFKTNQEITDANDTFVINRLPQLNLV